MNNKRAIKTIQNVRDAALLLAGLSPLLMLGLVWFTPTWLLYHVAILMLFSFVGVLMLALGLTDILHTLQDEDRWSPRH